MNWVIRAIDSAEMKQLISSAPGISLNDSEMEAMETFVKNSNPALAGICGGDLVGIVGFTPPTLMSDTAYIWVFTTPAVENHKVAFGRHARRIIACAKGIYPRITGHCLASNERSVIWLRTLGAEFGGVINGLISFEIRGD